MGRPGIVLYFDMLEPIRVLSDSDKGRLLVAMLEYGQRGTQPEFEGMLALAWGFVKNKLDRDLREYNHTVLKRQYAGWCRKQKQEGAPKMSFQEWAKEHMTACDSKWNQTITETETITETKTETETKAADVYAAATAKSGFQETECYPADVGTGLRTVRKEDGAGNGLSGTPVPTGGEMTAEIATPVTEGVLPPPLRGTPLKEGGKRGEMTLEDAGETIPQSACSADSPLCTRGPLESAVKALGGKLGRNRVFLSEAQVEDLLARMDLEAFDYYVDKLAAFIEKNGARVKNHYETILKWYREDGRIA